MMKLHIFLYRHLYTNDSPELNNFKGFVGVLSKLPQAILGSRLHNWNHRNLSIESIPWRHPVPNDT